MALIWADGFDHYGTRANLITCYTLGSGVEPRTGIARTGDYGCRFNSFAGAQLERAFAGRQTIIIGAAFNVVQFTGNTTPCLMVKASGNVCGYVKINTDGSISVYSSGNNLRSTSLPGLVQVGSYAFLEMRIFSDAANGTIEARLNNQRVSLVTGVNTNGAPITSAGVQDPTNGDIYGSYNIDDLYIFDTTGAFQNDFAGDIRCRTRFVTANGATQDWTPNNAPAFSEINQVPPDPANHFIAADAVDDVSNFALAPLPVNTAYAAGVMVHTYVSKTDAGICEITPQLSSLGTVASGGAIAPSTNPGIYSAAFDVDPATGNAWLLPNLQTLLFQVKRTA